jgi:RHS repeat-associated protein
MRKPGVVYYLHADHLGSTSLATCGSGSACGGNGAEIAGSRTWYKPYGEVRAGGGSLPTDYGFTGQRREASIGLMDYRARMYDPLLARFISADTIVPSPSSPQSLNRYSYCLGNPLYTSNYLLSDCESAG